MITISIDDKNSHDLNVGDTLKINGPNPKLIGHWRLYKHTDDTAFFEDETRLMTVTRNGQVIKRKPKEPAG